MTWSRGLICGQGGRPHGRVRRGGEMKPSADVARLAGKMSELRAEQPPRPLPFLIGDLCGERAGVPSPAEIGRAALGSLFERSPTFRAQLLPAGVNAPDDEVEAAFLGWLGQMTHLQRYRVLEPFYRRVPVPLFYQDLADLLVGGFVTHILTTNVDTLLEQALDGRGLTAGRDYGVQVRSAARFGARAGRADADDDRQALRRPRTAAGPRHGPAGDRPDAVREPYS